jgi:hypothetical protein
MWSGHRASNAERSYQARSMQAAAEWTGVLINMNADNVEGSLQRLRDGTVGELNSGFEASIAPYRDVVKTLRSRTTGQVESVSIEEVHRNPDGQADQRPAAPSLAPELATRTDTVLIVATSVSENAGTAPAPAPGASDGPAATPPGPTTTDARPGGAGPTTTDARPGGAGPTTVRWNLRLGVYRGGRRPLDLYYRIHAGINGAPMPAAKGTVPPEDIWHIVNYIRSLPYEFDGELGADRPMVARDRF